MIFLESNIPSEDRKSIENAFSQLINKYSHDFNQLQKPLGLLVAQHGGFVHQLFFYHFFSLKLSMMDSGKLWDLCLENFQKETKILLLDYRASFLNYLIQHQHINEPNILEYSQKKRLLDSTYTDSLTGLYNQRYFGQCLMKELSRSKRSGLPLTLIFFDIDHFKNVNDQYGHLTGDYILKEVGRVISITTRSSDMPCRYGGEEFAIILPDTDTLGAITLAKRIQKRVGLLNFQGVSQKITMSGGISSYPKHATEMKELVHTADKALYKAKANGRNQVLIYERSGDQRRQNRKTLQTTGQFQVDGSAEKQPFITKNISQTGILIQTISSVKLGDTLKLNINLPKSKNSLKCVARAVHIHHAHKVEIFELGLEIVHIDGKDQHTLISLLAL